MWKIRNFQIRTFLHFVFVFIFFQWKFLFTSLLLLLSKIDLCGYFGEFFFSWVFFVFCYFCGLFEINKLIRFDTHTHTHTSSESDKLFIYLNKNSVFVCVLCKTVATKFVFCVRGYSIPVCICVWYLRLISLIGHKCS